MKTKQAVCAAGTTVSVVAVRGQPSEVGFHLLPQGRVPLVSVAVLARVLVQLRFPSHRGVQGLQMYTAGYAFYV